VAPTARHYVLPPGTPKDRVQILRKAFLDTMKDPDFVADANKVKLDINPRDGAEFGEKRQGSFHSGPEVDSAGKGISQVKIAIFQSD